MNSTRRLRYLIDIIVIALGYFGLDALLMRSRSATSASS
jgi:hypothetical protein